MLGRLSNGESYVAHLLTFSKLKTKLFHKESSLSKSSKQCGILFSSKTLWAKFGGCRGCFVVSFCNKEGCIFGWET